MTGPPSTTAATIGAPSSKIGTTYKDSKADFPVEPFDVGRDDVSAVSDEVTHY